MPGVSASVVGRFAQPSGGSAELLIEPDLGVYADGNIHLLLHPTDPDISVYASVGEVSRGDTKAVVVPSGIATFSGSAQANLPKRPVYSSPQFDVLFAFNGKGEPIQISVNYNALTNVLSASESCTAAVKYTTYVSASRKLVYVPATTTLGLGVSQEFGTIAAFKPPSGLITYEVLPFEIVNGNAVVELYRIVSSAVTTPDGEFEKPPNYPNDGIYVGSGFVLDIDISLETERVHEIGYMDEAGRGWVNSYFVSRLEPFVGNNGYTIPTSCRVATVDRFPKNLQLKAKSLIAARGLGCN